MQDFSDTRVLVEVPNDMPTSRDKFDILTDDAVTDINVSDKVSTELEEPVDSACDKFAPIVANELAAFIEALVCTKSDAADFVDDELGAPVDGIVIFDERALPLAGGILDILVVLSAE